MADKPYSCLLLLTQRFQFLFRLWQRRPWDEDKEEDWSAEIAPPPSLQQRAPPPPPPRQPQPQSWNAYQIDDDDI